MTHPPSFPPIRWRRSHRRWVLLLLSLLTTIAILAPTIVAAHTGTPRLAAQPTPALSEPVATGQRFEQQGRAFYTAGRFSEAVSAFQQAAAAYETEGDALRQAMTLSNLALTQWHLGVWAEANQAIARSLSLLQRLEQSSRGDRETQRQQVLVQTLDVQGRLHLEQGQTEEALLTWQRAEQVAEQLGDTTAVLRSQIHQSQALQALGLYRRAIDLLTSLERTLEEQPASLEKAVGLRSLGEALQVGATLERAQQVLQSSLAIAEQLQLSEAISAAQLSLGNVLRAQGDRQGALTRYQQAAAIAPLALTQVQAQLNQLGVLVELNRVPEAEQLVAQLQPAIDQLPLSRSTIDARVNFANSLMRLGSGEGAIELEEPPPADGVQRIGEGTGEGTRGEGSSPQNGPAQVAGAPRPQFYWQAAQVLAVAADQARQLGDRRAESYALGSLGTAYERMHQWTDAQTLTTQALLLSQRVNAPDIAYRWQWQLGRVLKAQWKDSATRSPLLQQEAIAAYTEAVNTLQSIRGDLLAINPEIQFSFQGNIEPVYRELVGLLLEGTATPAQLEQARTVIESLQLAELDNFFREACLNAQQVDIDEVDRQAAVLYPIILDERLEIIVSIPQQPLRHYSQPVSSRDIEDGVIQLRRALTIRRVTSQLAPQTRQFYDWLIRPVAADLEASGVQTLVFVLDGALRNVPMGALNDGEHYLIEQYSIALTPGLQLLAPRPLQQQQFDVLAAGLTEARQGFSPLPGVVQELQRIQTEVPTRILLNQEFTEQTFQEAVREAPAQVIHLATHGNFSSNLEETFVLTWDDRIDINQLNGLIQSTDLNRQEPIELLVLSACQTASGDRRAALGLAGMAVRSGARSTIASLWNVDDQATSQM
ncbi:MAG: CHAT domain-containing protein, partial [Leptolyngbyaceae cyanobacterium SL_7_1]|nr:CHAT domain-containing protein [Leptolyngbyaceae cyanobacterium SL_7_1]